VTKSGNIRSLRKKASFWLFKQNTVKVNRRQTHRRYYSGK